MPKIKKIGDMQPQDIVGAYKTATIKHHDGCVRQLLYTNQETAFPEGKKIISVTDLDGYITHANSTFVYMSGYSRDELIGSPHYILRHPDMPRVAFQGLWDSLAKDGYWEGVVKNLRKDGGYYWVFASVFPLRRHGELVGYTSSREAPPIEKVQACIPLYQDMLKQETAPVSAFMG